ncbi:MAG: transposase [Thiobacillaceae bacterium]
MSEITVQKFIGIDVSKATWDVCIAPPGQALHVTYDEVGISQIVERLKEISPALIVLEATGGLEVRVASEMASAGLPVAVINPRQARDFAKASGQVAKTDQVDAAMLAAFAQAIRPQARPLKNADTRALDDLVSRRRQLIAMRKFGTFHSLRTQSWSYMRSHCARLPRLSQYRPTNFGAGNSAPAPWTLTTQGSATPR